MVEARVLIVDDDEDVRDALGIIFSQDGYACELVPSGAQALDTINRRAFDVVIADVRMAGMDGLELLDRVKREQPTLPVILMTGMGQIHDAVDAMKRGAFQYLSKPYNVPDLMTIVGGAIDIRRRRASEVVRRAPAPTPNMELIGSGRAMRELRDLIDLVAASSAPVLITGETGAGKELVAHAIHERGRRCGQPFVAVNTSAIPEELLEGELFGHVRGAFSGALQGRKGLITEASGGTLLLDEIGDMPLSLQAKILRVVQSGEVRPVGSDRIHHVDVRIIAATHRNLPALVREGRFREDLYFRLNVLPLVVPALRDRREDIPELIAHLLGEARARAPQALVQTIAPEAIEMLASWPWAGNVRELAAIVERLVVFVRAETVTTKQLSALHAGQPTQPDAPQPLISAPSLESVLSVPWPTPAGADEKPWTLKRMTQVYTEQILAQTGGDKRRAAEILDVDLSTLYRWKRANPELTR